MEKKEKSNGAWNLAGLAAAVVVAMAFVLMASIKEGWRQARFDVEATNREIPVVEAMPAPAQEMRYRMGPRITTPLPGRVKCVDDGRCPAGCAVRLVDGMCRCKCQSE